MFDQEHREHSPDQIVTILYTAGFRLTGSQRAAQDLAGRAVDQALGNGGGFCLPAALQTLCHSFMQAPAPPSPAGKSSGNIQVALLELQPLERLVVVLRDTLGRTYPDIAGMTSLDEPGVARLLSAGRRALQSQVRLNKVV